MLSLGSLVTLSGALAGYCASPLPSRSPPPVVDLGYARYQGYFNGTSGLNVWKSIRYAAPPVGNLRWQASQPPASNSSRGEVTLAVDQPPLCPQTGASGTPSIYGFNSGPGDEDCLYLNVYAAPETEESLPLPVLVWIHGGGYGDFGAVYDPSAWMNTNDNRFVTVEIQYRLGAFGFLSSDQVKARGRLNVGLLDQRRALQWVQEHVAKFGGDPDRVTVGGESSGAGSVMYHVLAYGAVEQEEWLFDNVIAASPYTAPIYRYDDTVPTTAYEDFVLQAGCGHAVDAFDCLVDADSSVLQKASGTVSTTGGSFGSWAFLPVIDGVYIREKPAVQLAQGNVTGKRILVGNNANEGVPLTNPNVNTRSEYDAFINTTFPFLSTADIAELNSIYHISTAQAGNSNGTRYDTLGNDPGGPTALNESEMATGIQQTVFDISAESIYDCPAQWLAEAFSSSSSKHCDLQAWKYQYSVTPAYHGADLSAYFAVDDPTYPNPDFRHAFQKILGNFIVNNTPVISVQDATAGYANASIPIGEDGMIEWPEFTPREPWQMDLNTTGGTTELVTVTPYLSYYQRMEPGIVNVFRVVNAYEWEGGRGERCRFWEGT